jgi:hypothetical protein
MNLANIRTVTATLPPRVLIHGPEGIGKTTLASKFPSPVFAQTEDGTPAGTPIASFGFLETFAQVRDALSALASEKHDFKTVVIDSADRLENLVWWDVCSTQNWASIETPGYGKGYIAVDKWWIDILAGLDYLRRERGMITVLLAHSTIERIDDPRTASYTSYQLRLHKRARGLIQDAMDVIGFLTPDTSDDAGFGKKRARADGGSARWLHLEGRPSFVAKNRYGLPAKMMIPRDFDYDASFAPYFPSAVAGQRTAANPAHERGHNHDYRTS